jgi:hypothetical protein
MAGKSARPRHHGKLEIARSHAALQLILVPCRDGYVAAVGSAFFPAHTLKQPEKGNKLPNRESLMLCKPLIWRINFVFLAKIVNAGDYFRRAAVG